MYISIETIKTSIKDPLYLAYKPLFADLKAAIAQYGKGDVFDIGCGNKPYLPLFQGIKSYKGCDVVQSSDNSVDILCTTDAIPVGDSSFDTVISTQVMEHVADHRKMLSEAARILKKDGYIILSVPMAWQHHEMPYDFFRFTKYGLQSVFENAGLAIEYIKPNGGKWALLGQMRQNIIMSSTRGKKGIFRAILRIFHRYCLKYAINIWYSLLEKWDYDDDFITLNFVVVAKKK